MKPYLFVSLAVLSLAGCSDEPEEKPWKDADFREIHPAAQVAIILKSPIIFFAFAAVVWAGAGVSLIGSKRKGDEP